MAINVGYLSPQAVSSAINLSHLAGVRASAQQAVQQQNQLDLAYGRMAQDYQLAQQQRNDRYASIASENAENARYRDFLIGRDEIQHQQRMQLEGLQQAQYNQREQFQQQNLNNRASAQQVAQQAQQIRTQNNAQIAQLQQAEAQGDPVAASLLKDYRNTTQGSQRALADIQRRYADDPVRVAQASFAAAAKQQQWLGQNFTQWKQSQPLPIEQEMMQHRYSADGSKMLDGKGGFEATVWQERSQAANKAANDAYVARTRDLPKEFEVQMKVSTPGEGARQTPAKVPVSDAYKSIKQAESDSLLNIDKQRASFEYWTDFEDALQFKLDHLQIQLQNSQKSPQQSQAYMDLSSQMQAAKVRTDAARQRLSKALLDHSEADFPSMADKRREEDIASYLKQMNSGGDSFSSTYERLNPPETPIVTPPEMSEPQQVPVPQVTPRQQLDAAVNDFYG